MAVCDSCTRQCEIVYSKNPVRYFNGQVRLDRTDVTSAAFGTPWSHTRTYSNQMPGNFNRGNGWNWSPAEWAYFDSAPANVPGAAIVLYSNLSYPRFYSMDPLTGIYSPMFEDLSTLVHNAGAKQFILTEKDGTVRSFHDFSSLTRPGEFVSETSPGGNLLQVVSESQTQALEVQQTLGSVTFSFLYQYGDGYPSESHASSSGSGFSRNLISVTSRQRTGSDPWQNITEAVYTYYDGIVSHGNQDDLMTVTLQVWQSSAGSAGSGGGAWADVATEYYRYYTPGESGGFMHGLKYVCLPQAFSDLSAVSDPFTASDAQVALFADYFYAYDEFDRVIQEQVHGASQTFRLEYVLNPQFGGSSSSSTSAGVGVADYNLWYNKTIETRPDGTQNIVYCNGAGQPMLSILRGLTEVPTSSSASASSSSSSGPPEWLTFLRYDSSGRLVLNAEPSAVAGYNDMYNDLLNYNSVTETFMYLKDHEGLIHLTSYYQASDAPQPVGYLKSQQIQQGQLGSPILLSSTTYTTVTVGSKTIYPALVQTQYPDASNPLVTIQTSFAYTFYAGTVQIQQLTTTLPVISTAHNGSGIANTNRSYFDIFGNLTWSMDERGFITGMSYDPTTGALIQTINDYNTSQSGSTAPPGWTTPTGGGLNIMTDYTIDSQGRTTQVLGPLHSIDLGGTATTIRTASWTVFDDVNHITYTGQGFTVVGSSSNSGSSIGTNTLVNPVSITQMGPDGRANAQIQAVAPSTAGDLAGIINAAGGGSAAFPQTSYTRWTTNQYTDCCVAASQRVYHTIPASGTGASGTNYDETDYGYDLLKRLYRTASPGGTLTEQVFDPRGLVLSTWIGTNDDGGTFDDPSGGRADPDNNMVRVTANQYDNGLAGGDGNLTQQTQFVDASTSRVLAMTYDFRSRLVTTVGEIDYFAIQYYDNLNRVVKNERYNTNASGHLIQRTATNFDDLSRVYQSIQYGVDPNSGMVGSALTSKAWFDQSGNTIMALSAGSSLYTKTTYDSLGRAKINYRGYNLETMSYAGAFTVTDDVVLEQVETTYNNANNTIQTTARQRYHNAPSSQTGALGNPSTTPNARVTYIAVWQDGISRTLATASYGTNGGTALARPDVVPASSNSVLVNQMDFDDAGNLLQTTDPVGTVTLFEYDDVGRKTTEINNYLPAGLSSGTDSSSGSSALSSSSTPSSSSGSGSCAPSDDKNRTTQYTFNADGLQATMTAINSKTTNQTTTWNYGTTLADSGIASSKLLASFAYPDSVGGSDVIAYTYNIQGERVTLTDQRGCVHTYLRDALGRVTDDCVTAVGTGVDTAILRLSATYEVRGLPETLTSYDNATIGSGSVVNQVQLVYNDFAQLIQDYQEHGGAVNMATTPCVQLSYANGSANTIRLTGITYPNGRAPIYSYGPSGGIDDAISRIDAIIDSDVANTVLAAYSFLGIGTPVIANYTQPRVEYTLASVTGSIDPITGDIYTGLDLFARIKDCRWYNTGISTDVGRLQYGFDRASNRLWRADLVAQSLSQSYDELYSYDGLYRLKHMQRGQLTSGNTSIISRNFAQCWNLDNTNNWSGFQQSTTGSNWTTVQSRTANTVNEITELSNSVGTPWAVPGYDAAGNMTTIPQPANPSDDYTAIYDAWNRMVSISDPATHQTIQQNHYDVRTFRTIRAEYTSGSLSETRHFYYSPRWQSVEERLGTSPDSSSPERQQVWGLRYIDDLLVRDRDKTGGGTLNERLYACQDAGWNLIALIDTTGTAQERYAYTSYGSPVFLNGSMSTVLSASAVDSEVLFTGQRFDSNAATYLYRMRVYHPTLGIFLSRDPAMNQVSAYSYVGSNPLLFVDPTGLILAAIDGTGSAAWLRKVPRFPNGRQQSHVLNFYNDYRCMNSEKRYWAGPGEVLLGAETGWDLHENDAHKFLCDRWCFSRRGSRGDPIDMVGWSRGGLAVKDVAVMLNTKGCTCCTYKRYGLIRVATSSTTYKPIPVRFLGLYDPVDMTYVGGDLSGNLVPPNVQNAFAVNGDEPADDPYKGRDYDSGSRFYHNWPRMTSGKTPGSSTNYQSLPLNATHGAIGGTPGYSPEQASLNYSLDASRSIQADQAMRAAAQGAGVPIPTVKDYGIPLDAPVPLK